MDKQTNVYHIWPHIEHTCHQKCDLMTYTGEMNHTTHFLDECCLYIWTPTLKLTWYMCFIPLCFKTDQDRETQNIFYQTPSPDIGTLWHLRQPMTMRPEGLHDNRVVMEPLWSHCMGCLKCQRDQLSSNNATLTSEVTVQVSYKTNQFARTTDMSAFMNDGWANSTHFRDHFISQDF